MSAATSQAPTWAVGEFPGLFTYIGRRFMDRRVCNSLVRDKRSSGRDTHIPKTLFSRELRDQAKAESSNFSSALYLEVPPNPLRFRPGTGRKVRRRVGRTRGAPHGSRQSRPLRVEGL